VFVCVRVLFDHYGCQKSYGNEKKTPKMIKTEIDLTGLRPIIFDILDVFGIRGSTLMLSTKKIGSAGVLGLPMASSKPFIDLLAL